MAKKIVTLLHYNFIAKEQEDDDNVVDGTRSIEDLFNEQNKRQRVLPQGQRYSSSHTFFRSPFARHPSQEGNGDGIFET